MKILLELTLEELMDFGAWHLEQQLKVPIAREGRVLIADSLLETRAKNILRLAGLHYLDEISALPDKNLLRLRGMGDSLLRRIRAVTQSACL